MSTTSFNGEIDNDRLDAVKAAIEVLRSTDPVVIATMAQLATQEHRTHQQNICRNMRSLIDAFAVRYNEGAYDPRNQGGLKWACQVAKTESNIPFI